MEQQGSSFGLLSYVLRIEPYYIPWTGLDKDGNPYPAGLDKDGNPYPPGPVKMGAENQYKNFR